MPRRASALIAAALALALAGCGEGDGLGDDAQHHDHAHAPTRAEAPRPETGPRPALGLMTSLPLYWPLGTGLSALASGTAASPWQRSALEQRFDLVPLDTLAPIPALTANAPETDPLAGLERIAIIQPRGLSPADNVAIDRWVRAGGTLLLVLDPALTGDYDLPLGDPAMPSLAALIPPVVGRWGLAVRFDEAQPQTPRALTLAGGTLPVWLSGTLVRADKRGAACTLAAEGTLAQCRIGEGRVTVLADAAVFEHRALAGDANAAIARVLRASFAR